MNESTHQTLESLTELRLPDLQARFGEIVGEPTRSPNKKFLLRRIGEALAAQEQAVDVPDGPPPSVPFKIPKHAALVLHAPVILDLYDTVGFSDVLRQLVLTIDAELTLATTAERILLDRWRKEIGVAQLSPDPKKRHSSLVRKLRRLGLPKLASTTKLGQALQTAGLVK